GFPIIRIMDQPLNRTVRRWRQSRRVTPRGANATSDHAVHRLLLPSDTANPPIPLTPPPCLRRGGLRPNGTSVRGSRLAWPTRPTLGVDPDVPARIDPLASRHRSLVPLKRCFPLGLFHLRSS